MNSAISPVWTSCALVVISLTSLGLSGCVGSSEPRRPGEDGEPQRWETSQDRTGGGRDPDRFSIEAALPRSGDPERPNVKAEVSVIEVARRGGLAVSAGARGSIVRGVVNLSAVVRARAGSSRRRSTRTSFIVVQAGRSGSIQLSQDAYSYLGGAYQSLEVQILEASPEQVRLALVPVTSLGRGDRERLALATEVTLAPGQAVLLGGFSQSESREGRGLGRHRERSAEREVVVLLTVDVLG
tara:strand:+ start:2129 stop:2851 length:723 start_codon:yes stop_codon:yes gene_type:complete